MGLGEHCIPRTSRNVIILSCWPSMQHIKNQHERARAVKAGRTPTGVVWRRCSATTDQSISQSQEAHRHIRSRWLSRYCITKCLLFALNYSRRDVGDGFMRTEEVCFLSLYLWFLILNSFLSRYHAATPLYTLC